MSCLDDDGCFLPAPPKPPLWKRIVRWLNPVYVYRRIIDWWRWRKFMRSGGFQQFTTPIIRRVYPNLIANEIVQVQPMTAPAGLVFMMDYRYGSGSLD